MPDYGRRTTIFSPLLLAAGVGVCAYAFLGGDGLNPFSASSPLIGKTVPDIAVDYQTGHSNFETTDILASPNGLLINFFASWCGPCIAEVPHLMTLKKRWVPIWGIATWDRKPDTQQFLLKHGNPFERLGRDPRGDAARAFGVSSVPQTFYVDKSGIVRWHWAGGITRDTIARSLDPVLGRYG